ncbi:MAG: S8 family serine peptidase, partial [Armatimonadota bacterium]|nr:S8 family serine peptidase [Armatimonadota bacterium]
MRKSICFLILLICLFALPTLCPALPWKHSFPKHGKYVPGEILVQFQKGAPADKIIKAHGASVKEIIPRINVYRLRLPKGKTVEQAEAELSRNPHVNFASPNHIIYAELFPNDELFFLQWGLYNSDGRCDIHAPEAWDLNTGSDNIIIAVIDTGIDSSHPDLAGKVIEGYNAIDGSSNTEDDHMHGTFVSGIAAAWGNDYYGIAGVNWNALLMPIKVLNADGYGEEADAAEGIIWAVEHGAKVINMSIGTYLHVPALEAAVNEAWAAGCVITAASGNDDLDDRTDPHYPSYYPATISVGATNEYD